MASPQMGASGGAVWVVQSPSPQTPSGPLRGPPPPEGEECLGNCSPKGELRAEPGEGVNPRLR